MKDAIISLRKNQVRYILYRKKVGAGLASPSLLTEQQLKQHITGLYPNYGGSNHTRKGDPVYEIKLVGFVRTGVSPKKMQTSKRNLNKTKLSDLVMRL